MKYLEDIRKTEKELGFTLRGNQAEIVNDVLVSCLDNNKKYIILSAPTGIGKSIIGATVAHTLQRLDPAHSNASKMLMGQNVLTEQYANSFCRGNIRDDQNFLLLKGAANYPCTLVPPSDEIQFPTAAECVYHQLRKAGEDALLDAHCNFGKCEYFRIKKLEPNAKHLITNYAYFFLKSIIGMQNMTTSIIWDECQTINDIFVEFCAIDFSTQKLQRRRKALANAAIFNGEVDKALRDLDAVLEGLKSGVFGYSNYMDALYIVLESYDTIKNVLQNEIDALVGKSTINQANKLKRILNPLEDDVLRIVDLINVFYKHVTDITYDKDSDNVALSIKPIFVGAMFSTLDKAKYHIFMSATMTDRYLIDTLRLDPEQTQFIKLDPVFPIENKKVVFMKTASMNYHSLKSESVLADIKRDVVDIVTKHKHENGIIVAPSFAMAELAAAALRQSKVNVEIFEHTRGTKIVDVLEKFKKHKKPAVLISPSIFEGVDLPDDLSRYQIIMKAPYPALGDKRMKYIADMMPHIYRFITLLKIIQACGRSVRNPTDYCMTYMLDTKISDLWFSGDNIWKNEFLIVNKE